MSLPASRSAGGLLKLVDTVGLNGLLTHPVFPAKVQVVLRGGVVHFSERCRVRHSSTPGKPEWLPLESLRGHPDLCPSCTAQVIKPYGGPPVSEMVTMIAMLVDVRALSLSVTKLLKQADRAAPGRGKSLSDTAGKLLSWFDKKLREPIGDDPVVRAHVHRMRAEVVAACAELGTLGRSAAFVARVTQSVKTDLVGEHRLTTARLDESPTLFVVLPVRWVNKASSDVVSAFTVATPPESTPASPLMLAPHFVLDWTHQDLGRSGASGLHYVVSCPASDLSSAEISEVAALLWPQVISSGGDCVDLAAAVESVRAARTPRSRSATEVMSEAILDPAGPAADCLVDAVHSAVVNDDLGALLGMFVGAPEPAHGGGADGPADLVIAALEL